MKAAGSTLHLVRNASDLCVCVRVFTVSKIFVLGASLLIITDVPVGFRYYQ